MDFQSNNSSGNKTKNFLEAKEKIVNIISSKGPSLPVHVGREVGLSMLFSSALLSELLSEKKLKISSMRVGGSPLYLIPGQEHLLEKFHVHLSSKEKEAFLALKENSILEDSKLHPAIRVALRSINDFAKPVQIKTPEEKLYWRFFLVSEQDALEMLRKFEIIEKKTETRETQKSAATEMLQLRGKKLLTPNVEKTRIKREIQENAEKQVIDIFEDKKSKKIEKVTKPKEKSVFVIKTMDFLSTKNFELLNDIELKKKEYFVKIRGSSQIGKIEFLCISKEKKKITEDDLSSALHKGQSMKLPVIFVSNGELDKKAQAWLSEWRNLISFMKME